jgi:hypothetical protein
MQSELFYGGMQRGRWSFRQAAELRSASPGLRPGPTQKAVSCGVGEESRFLDSREVRARPE